MSRWSTQEHPHEVLSAVLQWQSKGLPCALVVVTKTVGGAVRDVGAMMGVNSEGGFAGYVSGGCIDSDVIGQAVKAIADDTAKTIRYGAGSPYVDLPLPCGGAIEVTIVPSPDPEVIATGVTLFKQRKPVRLQFSQDGQLRLFDPRAPDSCEETTFQTDYIPKLKLRIAGRGADCLALVRLAAATGLDAKLQLTREEDVVAARSAGIEDIEQLTVSSALPPVEDDPWTAFILMFHDVDWEARLLEQALEGSAFYVGAVGSRRTHQKRCEALAMAGCSAEQIDRISAPVGLVPAMRDASMLAVSAMAEIIRDYHALAHGDHDQRMRP